MRGVFILGIGLVIAYWLDQSHYGGLYSRAVANMLHQIAVSFKSGPASASRPVTSALISNRD